MGRMSSLRCCPQRRLSNVRKRLPEVRARYDVINRNGTHNLCLQCTDTLVWREFQSQLEWKGSPREIQQCETFQQLAAPWKVMILSDGSVTKHLELMTGGNIRADCLSMEKVERMNSASNAVAMLNPPYLRREVVLVGASRSDARIPLVHATSWWNHADGAELLKDVSIPVGTLLRTKQAEVFRDIKSVYLGHCSELESIFNVEGPFWGRDYVFWHKGEPLTVIQETFSPDLSLFMGLDSS